MNDQHLTAPTGQLGAYVDEPAAPVAAQPRRTRTAALIAIVAGIAVAIALVVGVLAFRGPSWERDVRAAIDAEMEAMSATEQSEMCFALSLFGIEDGSGFLGAAAAFSATGDLGLESLPEGVEAREVFDVAVEQINSYC